MGLNSSSSSCLPVTLDFGESILPSPNLRAKWSWEDTFCGPRRTHFMGQVLFDEYVLPETAKFVTGGHEL